MTRRTALAALLIVAIAGSLFAVEGQKEAPTPKLTVTYYYLPG